MTNAIELSQVTRLADVGRMDRNVTERQIAEWVGDDPDRYSLLVVAEATRSRVPDAVTLWLTSPAERQEWLETLWLQEGRHQLVWYDNLVRRGLEDPATLEAASRLAALRQRRQEAHLIQGLSTPVWTGRDAAEVRALKLLREQHREVKDRLEEEMNPGPAALGEVPTPQGEALLARSDESFRDFVARDVQGKTHAEALTHPALLGRWRNALVELGLMTVEQLGVENPRALAKTWFLVPDKVLERNVQDPAMFAEQVNKLVFLTHLRVRMAERRRLSVRHGRTRYERWFRLVDDQLIGMFPDDYETLLEQERERLADRPPTPLPPHPAQFEEHAARLAKDGWTVRWIFNGQRVWLDAQRGGPWRYRGRLIVTAPRSRVSRQQTLKGQGEYKWRSKEIRFVYYPPGGGRYLMLEDAEAFAWVSREKPKSCPNRLVRQVLPQTWDALSAFVPPDGLRWRCPYPADVMAR